jgi:hypothetical protein
MPWEFKLHHHLRSTLLAYLLSQPRGKRKEESHPGMKFCGSESQLENRYQAYLPRSTVLAAPRLS